MYLLPWILTLAGAIPFLGAAVAMWQFDAPEHLQMLMILFVSYGVVILSFLSGIQWGLAIVHPAGMTHLGRARLLIWSNLVALLAWVIMLLWFLVMEQSAVLGIWLLAIGFGMQWGQDAMLGKAGFWPDWYTRLRHTISPIVILSCALVILRLSL